MGTIDPLPRAAHAVQQPRLVPPVADPAAKPPVLVIAPLMQPPTVAGAISITFGVVLFTLGSFYGWNLFLMLLGLAFIGAGYLTHKKAPAKLCPACRMEIPLEASVCGHCQRDVPA